MDANDRLSRAADEAADWWALLQDGQMSREERAAFVDWLRDSQTHIAEMLRLSQVHGALAHFQEWEQICTDGSGSQADVVALPANSASPLASHRDVPRWRGSVSLRRIVFATTLAAVAIAVAVIFVVTPWRGQSITTERGQRLEVVLDDGSLVRVDPQTHLRIKFDKSLRRIALCEGRAVFYVAKDPTRPFVVEANDMSVRAVGTAFGVERWDTGLLRVTVAEGRVALSAAPSMFPKLIEREAPIYLAANQQISLKGKHPAPVREVSSARELAWAEGRLVFRNDPVSKVVSEFNRYNHVQLSVADPILAARPVTGVFNATNPEAFVAFIQNAAAVRIERNAGRSIVIFSERVNFSK